MGYGCLSFSCPRLCLRVWSRELGSAVPSRVMPSSRADGQILQVVVGQLTREKVKNFESRILLFNRGFLLAEQAAHTETR